MRKQLLIWASLTVVAPSVLFGCSPNQPQSNTQAETQTTAQANQESGTLQLVANGEDFVREGFVTKDGWKISFNHVYTNLADVTAYQSNPPFNPETQENIQAKEKVTIVNQPKTVDLAQRGEGTESVLVAEVANAPAGHYNALSWKMAQAPDGPAKGQTLVMNGTASKEGRTIDFIVNIDREFEYICGEFVGDQRKGILPKGGKTDLEATFHFDHIFGDAEKPANDAVNTGALGFEPLAALAKDGKLEVNMAQLRSQLSAADYKRLEQILPTLGHVGEGHCKETTQAVAQN